MKTLLISFLLLLSAFILLSVVYYKLYHNFRRINDERNDLLEKFLSSYYASCNLTRQMNTDYKNFVKVLDETSEFVEDEMVKKELIKFRNQLDKIQKTKLEKDLAKSEEFMTDYEIHQLTHG